MKRLTALLLALVMLLGLTACGGPKPSDAGANKLVGIISHREELVENIPQQIRVRKSKNGSSIEIDTGF